MGSSLVGHLVNRSRRRFCRLAAASLLAGGSGICPPSALADATSKIASPATPSPLGTTSIVVADRGYRLIRDGQPYFIRGAGGDLSLDLLASSGGNSVRTWSPSRHALDEAHKNGLTVLMGLKIGVPRHGFNYADPAMVARQLEEVGQIVASLKDHPALLMWGGGNEVELNVAPPPR